MPYFSYGYTGSMIDQLSPWYDFVPFDGNLYDCEKGAILLRVTEGNPCAHTCIVSVAGSQVLEACDDFDGVDGDSSGWEVAERDIHHNSWEYVGIPRKDALSDEAIDVGIQWGRAYCADDSHGYSQGSDRMNPDWGGTDCSALVLLIVGVMIEFMQSGGDYTPPEPSSTPGWVSERAEWQGDMIGLSDTTDSGDDYAGVPGRPIRNIAIEGVGEYQVSDVRKGDFWPRVDHYDLSDSENGYAGDDQPIDRLRIFDPTVKYQLRVLNGEWHDVMQGTKDLGGSSDDFAGESGVQHDLLRVWRESGEQPRYNVYS